MKKELKVISHGMHLVLIIPVTISFILRIFRSRKKFSTTYAIVLFFFSRPFHENFKFLKNCPYYFHEILHSHSTPKGAPACAKALKSYGLDVRNIAKISPKMAKKQPFFDFFRFSQKLSIRFERNFLQLFYTILESYMCSGIKIVWLGCEKHSQNWPKNSHFSIFFSIFSKTVHTIRTKFSSVILHHIMVLYVQFH